MSSLGVLAFRNAGTWTGAVGAPTSFTATPDAALGGQINIAFVSVPAAYQTRIYRDGVIIATLAFGTDTYADTGLTSGTSYAYKVAAWDGSSEGTQSGVLNVTAPGTTTTYTMGVTADDGGATASIGISTTTIFAGRSSGANDESAWFRFPGIVLPQAATITTATLRINIISSASASIKAWMNAADNAAAPTSLADFGSKALSTANVTPTPPFAVGQRDIVITTIVQEIVNRGGWVSGNAMMALLLNNLSGNGQEMQITDFGSSPTLAAKLIIEVPFTPPVVGTFAAFGIPL